jgi:hypothetical protein
MTKRRLRKNLIEVIKHNRKNRYAVRSNHLLVKLLKSMNLDPELPLFEYYRLAQNRYERVSRSEKLTSNLYRGDVRDESTFYGDGTNEILMSVSEDVDILKLEKNWTSLTPVRVLSHPYTDLSLTAMDGRKDGVFNGLAVIQIDLVKLALQYRQWYQDQLESGSYVLRTPMQFMFEYPLTNALISHHDVAIQNRLVSLFKGEEVGKFKNDWPMYLKDNSQEVDDYLMDRIVHLHRRPMMYVDIMQEVPLVFYEDLLLLSRLPDVPATRQNSWALNLARVPIIRFLVQLDYEIGSQRNFQDMSRIRKTLITLERDRDMMVALPAGMTMDVMDYLKKEIGAYL